MIKIIAKISFIVAAFTTLTAFFYISPPFKSSKLFKELPDDSKIIIAVTHVQLAQDKKQNKIFWQNTTRVTDSLPTNKGYLGHDIRKKIFINEGWTLTIWTDEDALENFVYGKVHAQAMQQSLPAVKEARFVRFTRRVKDIPLSWQQVEKIMQQQGRKLY